MVLISVQSVEDDVGYEFKNDFAESIIINPNSSIQLLNCQFERRADFVVLDDGNQFQIQVGGPTKPLDVITIKADTYTAQSLSAEIQIQLNNTYHNLGHNFEVDYDYTNKRFVITDNYQLNQLALTTTLSYDNINPTYQESADAVPVDDFGRVDFSDITRSKTNYVGSSARIETTVVPSLAQGGSQAVWEIHTDSAIYPPSCAGVVDADGTDLETNGFMIGLSRTFGTDTTAPSTGVKQIANSSNSEWVVAGICFYADRTSVAKVLFIENGQDIGAPEKHAVMSGDNYRIILSPEGNDGQGKPIYQYKRVGGEWTNFFMTGSEQYLTYIDWSGVELHPFVGCDVPDTNDRPLISNSLTIYGQNQTSVVDITAGNTNERIKNHAFNGGSVLTKTVAGAVGAKDTANTGMITQPINADTYSTLSFKLPTTTTADFYVSVIDEQKRTLNQIAQGNGDDDLGVADPAWGNTVQNSNGLEATVGGGEDNFNPALCSFRFKAWDGDGDRVAPKNKIYYRLDQNSFQTESNNSIIEDTWGTANPDGTFDWTANPDALFMINVAGSGNLVELVVSPLGDRSDNITLQRLHLPRSKFQGIKGLNTYSTIEAFAPNSTILATVNGAIGVGGLITITTDGNGDLTDSETPILQGHNFTPTGAVDIIEVDNQGTPLGGEGEARVGGQVNFDRTIGMGTAYDANKTYQGYSYWMGFGNPEVATADASEVNEIQLSVQSVAQAEYSVLFKPRYEPIFGDMLGFKKDNYVLASSGSDNITSDDNPDPNKQVGLHPTIMVNIDNLPIKSYIGKKYKADALINDKPIGNQQGLTRMIAKLPRFHDDQGNGGSAGVGPYYYDYFEYVVPLHNATQIVLNELEITFRNPDGTLATDIIKSHLLLKLNNVQSAGDGLGSIGQPIHPAQNGRYDKLNMTNGQFMPTITEGQPLRPTATDDQWGHANKDAKKSHAL